jgi:hypothetical protein
VYEWTGCVSVLYVWEACLTLDSSNYVPPRDTGTEQTMGQGHIPIWDMDRTRSKLEYNNNSDRKG